MSITFRDLTANDIEFRISTVKKNGVSLLLYSDKIAGQVRDLIAEGAKPC